MDYNELEKRLIEIRRSLHSSPECGFNLPKTLGIIKEVLKREGIGFRGVGRAGLVADILGGKGNDAKIEVLLRADTDALPIEEKAELPFAAKNGNMHACGHDLHTAMLLGAAIILRGERERLPYGVRLVFQPAEEELSGACDMLGAGLFSDISPRLALALHVGVGRNMSVGKVTVPAAGTSSPAAKFFKITLLGKSAHGAMPALGTDALLAAADLRVQLARTVGEEDGILTVGRIRGGEAAGAIADYTELSGSMRAASEEKLQSLEKHVKRLISECERRHSVKAAYSVDGETVPLEINEKAREHLIAAVSLTEGAEAVLPDTNMAGGSEDFAYISRLVPSAYAVVGAGDGGGYPLHNGRVVFDERAIIIGAKILAAFASSLEE
ncbi:MAG: amidohydrolase [Clostridia bacterium]|nr:amidohydrolase [Clostridia bacterium]